MAFRQIDIRVEADLAAVIDEPIRARLQIGFMLRLRGDAGKAQVFAELREETVLVLFQIIKHALHGVEIK
jgi:hypothetical protein